MSTSEDYLDSLLKQANVDVDPDSAISKVSEITKQVEAEKAEMQLDNLPDDLAEKNENGVSEETPDFVLPSEDSNAMMNPDEIAALLDSLTGEDISNDIASPEATLEDIVDELKTDLENVSDLNVINEADPAEVDSLLSELESIEPVGKEIKEDDFDPEVFAAQLLAEQNSEMVDNTEEESPDDILASLENLSEMVSEETTENVTEDFPEEINVNLSEENIEVVSEEIPEEIPSDASEEIVEEISSEVAEEISEEVPSEAAEEISEEVPSEVAEEVTEEITEEISVDLPENLPEEASDSNSDEAIEEIADNSIEMTDESVEEASNDEVSIDLDSILSGLQQEDEEEKSDSGELDGLSAEEIENLINKAEEVEAEHEVEPEIEVDMDDIASLEALGIFDKDATPSDEELGISESGMDEISDLLNKSDSKNDYSLNEDDELLNLLTLEKNRLDEAEDIKNRGRLEEADDNPNSESKKEKKKIFKKKKKEETPVDPLAEIEPKKKSFIGKILEFLTATDESEEETLVADSGAEGFEGVQGENKEILDQLDAEGEEQGKKKKKKKDKKGKKQETSSEEGEEGEEGEGNKKKKKEKKPKKEKKEKVVEPDNSKPLNKKNVKKIFIMCFLILAFILLVVMLVPGMLTKKNVRKAFYNGDYETVYTNLYGQKLNDSDQLLYDRSKVVLKVRHKYDAYLSYNKMNMKTEALDQLLQAVSNYEFWCNNAIALGAELEFKTEYRKIISALEEYGLSEADAWEIINLPTDLEYSLKVYSVANHTDYIDPNLPLPEIYVPVTDEAEEGLADELPEEGL